MSGKKGEIRKSNRSIKNGVPCYRKKREREKEREREREREREMGGGGEKPQPMGSFK